MELELQSDSSLDVLKVSKYERKGKYFELYKVLLGIFNTASSPLTVVDDQYRLSWLFYPAIQFTLSPSDAQEK